MSSIAFSFAAFRFASCPPRRSRNTRRVARARNMHRVARAQHASRRARARGGVHARTSPDFITGGFPSNTNAGFSPLSSILIVR